MKYGKTNITAGRLQSVEIYEGETIEQKIPVYQARKRTDNKLATRYAKCLKVKLTNRRDSIRTTEPGNKKQARINRMPIDTGTHATRR